jgi:hypothetical protein
MQGRLMSMAAAGALSICMGAIPLWTPPAAPQKPLIAKG